MIKGFAITPVQLGRIAIGEVVERNGKRLPSKLDHIIITGMVQSCGEWVEHPAMAKLKEEEAKVRPPKEGAEVKLRSIPVRIMFDRPESNFSSDYTCFDDKGRPICTGDGETARRRTSAGLEDVPCPGSDVCSFGEAHRCKQFGRLIVGLESEFENDPLSGFIFRTTSFNSIRALTARLQYLSSSTQGKMSGMPCNLRMRAKSTAGSMRRPIFYLDLEPAGGLFNAVKVAREFRAKFEENGLDREALEAAVAQGMTGRGFHEDESDGQDIIDEFLLSHDDDEVTGDVGAQGDASASQGVAQTVNAAEAVEQIRKLLIQVGMSESDLLAWLDRPDGSLEMLSNDEASTAIQALTATLEKASSTQIPDKADEQNPAKPRAKRQKAEKSASTETNDLVGAQGSFGSDGDIGDVPGAVVLASGNSSTVPDVSSFF